MVKRLDASVSFVFSASSLRELLEERMGPCASIYFPAHLRKTDARSDAIVFKNLCRDVEKMLHRDGETVATREIVRRLRDLDEPEFWGRGSEGVAIFAAPGFFESYRLPVKFPQLAVVGGRFHTKPMIRYLQSGTGYWLLALSLHDVVLYDGWGTTLQRVPVSGLPARAEATSASSDDEEDSKVDIERYFREVASGLTRQLGSGSEKPVVLAAQKQHQGVFRKVAHLPGLLEQGVPVDGPSLSAESLADAASDVLRPLAHRRVTEAREEYSLALSRGQASASLGDIARAVTQGRVRRLCVESGCRFWGLLDRTSGTILPGEEHKNAHDVDVYAELAELTLSHGGDVLVLGREDMPSVTGVAATFRY